MKYRVLFIFALFYSVSITSGSAYAFSDRCAAAERMYLAGDYNGAVSECERLACATGDSKLRNEAIYLAGLCYVKLRDYARAKECFGLVIDYSKDSMLVREAEGALTSMPNIEASAEAPQFYCVQVGCFSNIGNAQRLYERFRRKRYSARVIEETSGEETVYKVKIGRFASEPDAAEFAKKLDRMGYPTAVVAY